MITLGRRTLVAGNWKLHGTLSEATELATAVRACAPHADGPEVVLAPTFTALATVRDVLASSGIGLAAQDAYWEDRGAFTGAVSAALLADLGCTHAIVGHSERRWVFGDTDEDVQRKTAAVLRHGMTPIVCVGERLEERETGTTLDRVLDQVARALAELDDEALARVVIAYEPIWAIGTGRTATPADAQAVHHAVRAALAERGGRQLAEGTRILYGGSVKPDNAATLLAEPDVDGVLVGGASLDASSFCAILRAAG
jgi:triosephosphate isomerase